MKSFFTNRVVLNTIVLYLYTILIESILRIYMVSSFKDIAYLRIILSSFLISLSLSFITHFFNKIIARIIHIIYILFVGIYAFAEFGLYNFIGFFMGVGNTEQGTKVLSFIKDYLNSLDFKYYLIFIPVILWVVYYLLIDRKIMKNKISKKSIFFLKKLNIELFTLLIIITLAGPYYLSIKSKKLQNPLQTESNYSLWLYPENSNLAVNNFGVLVYGFCDLKSNILGINEENIYEVLEEQEKEEEQVTDYSRVIDDSAWKLLNENTTSSSKKALNNYFMNREITPKNEMTGIFKGKNLIIILMESVNEISIMNKDDFPTLYKLYNEGISFRNNYSPRNSCSTGNNEFTVLSSLFTINNTCTANTYANNKYFEGVFNIFNNAGYHTTSYHDYTQQYYRRKTIHAGLGSGKYYGVTDLGIKYDPKYEEWPDDKLLFQQAKKYYMNEDLFMVYFASVSPHQTYNVPSTLGDKYKNIWNDTKYNTSLKRYLSKLKIFDEALEELLKELESEGKLDDTVIALFGDHFPYGLTDREINNYLKANNASYTVNRNSTKNKDVDRTPLIIYNSKTEAKVINDYTTIIDLLPTLLNMFDVEYDPRLYLGTDIFSNEHISRAYFADGSWADPLGFYYAPTNKMNYNDQNMTYTNEELVKINKEITTRQKMSAKAIRENYFNYLGKGLEKYKILEE